MRSAKRPIQNESSAARRLQMVQNEDCTGNVDKEAWSEAENLALVEYLLLHTPEKWPATKKLSFWNSVAEFVWVRGSGSVKRSGM